MLARLDKPLCLIGTAKTAEAPKGRTIVAIALENEPRNRRVHEVDRQAPGVADSGGRDRVGGERDRPQDVRHLLQFLARTSMGAVQHRLSAVLALDAARQRTYPNRYRQPDAPEAGARQHRRHWSCLFSAAADDRDDHHVRTVLHALV